MAKKNRSTLKRYFDKGNLPSAEQFADLVDSTLNTIDEGFDKTPKDGFQISLIGDHERLISFFKPGVPKNAVWSIDYEKKRDRLLITKPDADANAPPAMAFRGQGKLDSSTPAYTVEVGGVIAAEGRIGANPNGEKTVAADGEWHDIAGPLKGCHAIEVMAGVGKQGSGKYALMNAIAMNTFNPRGWWSDFLSLKKRIKYHHAYYLSRGDRIKLRWHHESSVKEDDKNSDKEDRRNRDTEGEYYLQMRTVCGYSGDIKTGDIKIRYYLSRLWFDEIMSESQQKEAAAK
jgi:hypothetical protein